MKKEENPVINYICNPEVVLREEDSDGGLLFNPDTNQVRVLNKTGLFIWKMCEESCNIKNIVNELKQGFQNVPQGEAEKHVNNFIEISCKLKKSKPKLL